MTTTNKTRTFGTCKGCNSAVLITFLNPVRHLCKICEARDLASEILTDEQLDHDLSKLSGESDAETQALEDMGLGRGHDDLDAEDRIESIDPDVTKQREFDALRKAQGLSSRHFKTVFKPATIGQVGALKKLGWDAETLRPLKLSIADASRLLQKGPQWSKKA